MSAHLTQAKLTGFVILIFTTWYYYHRVTIKRTYLAHPLLFWHCVYCSSFMGLGPSNKAPETVLLQVCIHCCFDTGVHSLLCYRHVFFVQIQVYIHCPATGVHSLFCYKCVFIVVLQVGIHFVTGVNPLFCYRCAFIVLLHVCSICMFPYHFNVHSVLRAHWLSRKIHRNSNSKSHLQKK